MCGFALRNFVDLDPCSSPSAHAVLRPGGRLAALDAAIPTSAYYAGRAKVFFMGMVPVLGKLVAGDGEAYRYLPKSTAYLSAASRSCSRCRPGRVHLDHARDHRHRRLGAAAHGDAHMSYERRPRPGCRPPARSPPPDDLLEALGPGGFAWLRDGHGFVTSGVAAPGAGRGCRRAAHRHRADDGPAPLAVGALPFHAPGRGELVVPAQLVGLGADGRAWVTEISPLGAAPLPLEPVAEREPEPGKFVVRRTSDPQDWAASVAAILAAVERGELKKAVLARQATIEANRPFDLHRVLDRLRARQAGCFVFADGGFIGASPELLVARTGTDVVSRPMAGTVARGATEHDDLRGSKRSHVRPRTTGSTGSSSTPSPRRWPGTAPMCTRRPTPRSPGSRP